MQVQNKISSMLNLPPMDTGGLEDTKNKEAKSSSLKDSVLVKNQAYELDLSAFKEEGFASEFGFRIDESGFFDQRLNLAARLPSDYKIDLANLKAIKAKLPKEADLMHTLNSYFVSISSINEDFLRGGELNKEEISKLTAGFSSHEKLAKLYKTQDELELAKSTNKALAPLNLHNNITDFHFQNAQSHTAKDELLKPFIKEDGSVMKSGLYLNFIRNDLADKNKRADFFKEPLDLDKSIGNFKDFLAAKPEDFLDKSDFNMSFDLYLYMNSVDKSKLDDDKLELLHTQYLSYKNTKLDELKDKSQLYDEYILKTKEFLKNVHEDFKANIDEDLLAKVDASMIRANDRFIKQRTTEIKMNETIKAYMSFF